jgi:hypothetical protein
MEMINAVTSTNKILFRLCHGIGERMVVLVRSLHRRTQPCGGALLSPPKIESQIATILDARESIFDNRSF